MKITFVVVNRCGCGDGGYALWAYHDNGPVIEVATFKGDPGRHLVESCVLVYERGFRSGLEMAMDVVLKREFESEIIFDKMEAENFMRLYFVENNNIG